MPGKTPEAADEEKLSRSEGGVLLPGGYSKVHASYRAGWGLSGHSAVRHATRPPKFGGAAKEIDMQRPEPPNWANNGSLPEV